MAQRVLVLILFVLAVVTSSALTVLYLQNKNGGAPSGDMSAQIAKYIAENPDVIVKGLKDAQMKQAAADSQKSAGAVKDILPKLQERKPIAGKADAPVTFAVFHDYNCGFCRKSVQDVIRVANENKNVKIVLIDFPILGDLSMNKAKVSVAISRIAPDKSFEFFKVMEKETPQNLDQVIQIAERVGVDSAKLKSEIESSEVENIISENRSFAEAAGVQGTPAFIINDQIIKGAMGYDAFKAAIDKAS